MQMQRVCIGLVGLGWAQVYGELCIMYEQAA